MDPQAQQAFNFIMTILPWVVTIVAVSVGGALLNNWLKIKNGYPLSNSWGMPLHPKKDGETLERVRLLTSENAQLRAELGLTPATVVADIGSRAAKGMVAAGRMPSMR